MNKVLRETFAREIHGVYCRQYKENEGKDYWTKGNYDLLPETIKNYDRAIVDWVEKQLIEFVSLVQNGIFGSAKGMLTEDGQKVLNSIKRVCESYGIDITKQEG